jgi:hypothetical protein
MVRPEAEGAMMKATEEREEPDLVRQATETREEGILQRGIMIEVDLEKPEKWPSEDKLASLDPLKVLSHVDALKCSLANFGRSPAKRVEFVYSSLSKDVKVQVKTGMLGKKVGDKNVLKVLEKLARGMQVPGYQPGFKRYRQAPV